MCVWLLLAGALNPLNIGFLLTIWRCLAASGPKYDKYKKSIDIKIFSTLTIYQMKKTNGIIVHKLPNNWVIWKSWSISDSPGKRGSPDNISEYKHPIAQISTSL